MTRIAPLLLPILPLAGASCTEQVVCSGSSNPPGATCSSTWVQDPDQLVMFGVTSCRYQSPPVTCYTLILPPWFAQPRPVCAG